MSERVDDGFDLLMWLDSAEDGGESCRIFAVGESESESEPESESSVGQLAAVLGWRSGMAA